MKKPNPKKKAAASKAGKARQNRGNASKRENLKRDVMSARVDQGASYRQIAALLGISAAYAFELHKEAMEEIRADNVELAKVDRDTQLAWIDGALSQVYPLIMDTKLRIETVNDVNILSVEKFDALNKLTGSLCKLMERRAKVLGTDAPEKLDLNTTNSGETLEELRVRVEQARNRRKQDLRKLRGA